MGAKHWAARALRNSKVKNKFPCYWALSSESPWSILKLSDISSVFSQVLQAIPLVIIVAFHLPLKIATMTPTRAIVPLPIKELGGTTVATVQILTAYTWRDSTLLMPMESTGRRFEASFIHWNVLRWRSKPNHESLDLESSRISTREQLCKQNQRRSNWRRH